MSKYDYDIAIIGGGSAGLTGAKLATSLGKRTILIEKTALGGDCLFYGCVPSKALISINKILHSPFLDTLNIKEDLKKNIDFQKIAKDIKSTINKVGEGDSKEVLEKHGVEIHFGEASFVDPHTIIAGNRTITSKYFLIATGSHPFVPSIKGLDKIKYYTNENIFNLEKLPKHLVIIGGGPIGCEMAQAFRYLGSEVSIIQRNEKLLPNDDQCASDFILNKFKEDGINVLLKEEILEVEQNKEIIIKLKSGKTLQADILLFAVGRKPNINGLNLEHINVKTNYKGLELNKYLQTSVKNIYGAGDIAGSFLFTHFAAHQASSAIINMVLPIKQPSRFSNIPWVTFVNPEIAHCGETQDGLDKSGKSYSIVEFPYNKIDRAITEKAEEGFIRVYKDKNDFILGATIIGERAGELIMEIVIAMSSKIKTSKLLSFIHPYPTFSSGIQIGLYEEYLKNNKIIKFLKKF